MSTTIITADLHLSDNPRDSYRHDFMRGTLPQLLKNKKCDSLYVLGDLTESKDYHGAWLVNTVVEHFYKLSKICKVVIIRGNHDYTLESHPFYAFLIRVPNITWVNKPTEIGNHILLPHTHRWKPEWRGIDFQKHTAIFCHQTFEGFRGDSGHQLKGLPRHTFPTNIKVFNGDIHSPQKIDNITYVSAPYLVDFGDSYTPRVLQLYEKGRLITVSSIICEGPQKRLLEIDSDINLYHEGSPFKKGDILKIRVRVSTKDREHWLEFKQTIIKWADKNGYVLWQVQPVFDTAKRIKAWKQASPEADEDTLARYGKTRKVPERTLKTGQWLRQKV